MLQVLGRLHPLVVHFPIGLLIAAAMAELFRRRRDGPSEAGLFCLALGTLGALLAASSGWLFAEHDPPGVPALLLRHRWCGVATALVSCATLGAFLRWRRSADPAHAGPARIGIALSLGLVAYTGHLGGEMVYGEGFWLEPLRERGSGVGGEPAVAELLQSPANAPEAEPPRVSLEPNAGGGNAPAAEAAGAAGAVDYPTQIRPILEGHCYDCHGDGKRPKGKLRLSRLATVLARPPEEAVIVPGAPGESELYRRLTLPLGDEDVMPPEDEERLTVEEIELVRRWIAEGARWSEPEGSVPAAEEPDEAPEAKELTFALGDAQRTARDAALERLRARGARAERVSLTSDAVEVDLGVAFPPATDADLALLAGLEPCLVELSLARSAVTDAGLAALASFGELRRLRLDYTTVGDAGLVHLVTLGRLESLGLFHTRVGDAGSSALHGLTALERLYLGETAVSERAVEELARALPGCTIERGTLPAFPDDWSATGSGR